MTLTIYRWGGQVLRRGAYGGIARALACCCRQQGDCCGELEKIDLWADITTGGGGGCIFPTANVVVNHQAPPGTGWLLNLEPYLTGGLTGSLELQCENLPTGGMRITGTLVIQNAGLECDLTATMTEDTACYVPDEVPLNVTCNFDADGGGCLCGTITFRVYS